MPSSRQDVAARGPDQRREGEDVAAAATAGEVEALDVAAERVDLLGVGLDLGPGRRSLFGIEPGLLEELLVPDQHRAVGRERQAVDPALVGAGLDMRRRELIEIGQGFRPVRDVLELAGCREGRRVDQIERQRVGRRAAGSGGAVFRNDLGIGNDVELDLVLVALVECIDDARHEVRRRRRAPRCWLSRRPWPAARELAQRPRRRARQSVSSCRLLPLDPRSASCRAQGDSLLQSAGGRPHD